MSPPATRRAGLARTSLATVIAVLVALAWPATPIADAQIAPAGLAVVRSDDMVLGRPGAKAAVIEYASLGCPHCAAWANQVFPAFRKAFIDTGKARYILRELLYGDSTVAAAGFMVARCAGPRGYYPMVEAIFADYQGIETRGVDEMLRVAKGQGFTRARFEACLKDPEGLAALRARADRHQNADHVTGTPTFIIAGGPPREGEVSLADLATAIEAASRRR